MVMCLQSVSVSVSGFLSVSVCVCWFRLLLAFVSLSLCLSVFVPVCWPESVSAYGLPACNKKYCGPLEQRASELPKFTSCMSTQQHVFERPPHHKMNFLLQAIPTKLLCLGLPELAPNLVRQTTRQFATSTSTSVIPWNTLRP